MPVRESPGVAGASASYARVLPPQARELKLSVAAVAQVERADPVAPRVRPVEETPVHAPLAGALPRQLDVDLRREHLVHAAHVAAAAERLVVAVEEGALLGDAGGGRDHPVAERRAAPALVGLGLADDARHRRRIMGWMVDSTTPHRGC